MAGFSKPLRKSRLHGARPIELAEARQVNKQHVIPIGLNDTPEGGTTEADALIDRPTLIDIYRPTDPRSPLPCDP
jgi:hypothetical protein